MSINIYFKCYILTVKSKIFSRTFWLYKVGRVHDITNHRLDFVCVLFSSITFLGCSSGSQTAQFF